MGSGLVGYSIGAVGSKEVGINDAKQATRLAQFTKKNNNKFLWLFLKGCFLLNGKIFFLKKA